MMDGLFIVLQVLSATIWGYQFTLSLFGIYLKKGGKVYKPQKSFAVLVAAHNEETVIGALIENLKALDYPKELYDIFVICDNCSDSTADIVRRHEVYACERHNLRQRGKGHAIEWMLGNLWEMPRQYDAVIMLDADNLISTNFLCEMNNDLCSGARVIQGYLDAKNPEDSWITLAYSVTYWYCNRMWQLSRKNLNMACFLGGTGVCVESKLLKEIGWGATSLVEDLEFTARCTQNGVNPVFNYNARIYDEKPLTLRASARQRVRWMQGHFTIARRYFLPLLWGGIKKCSLTKFDMALYTIFPYMQLVTFHMMAFMWIDAAFFNGPSVATLFLYFPEWVRNVMYILSAAIFVLVLILEGVKSWRVYASLIAYPLFIFSWFPITVYAFFTQNNKVWSHTEHTRALRLEEMQGKQV